MSSRIILLGPMQAGKSTLGKLLADKLKVEQYSMDRVCWDYYNEVGYDEQRANEYFLSHPANRALTKFVVYTQGKTAEETRDEILQLVGVSKPSDCRV